MIKLRGWLTRHWLWAAVNLGALWPLLQTLSLIRRAPAQQGPYIFAGATATNLLLFTGKAALVFLVLSLACTPAARLLGWRQAITVRKTLGLWGFGFALLHGLLFMGGKEIFYAGRAWQTIWRLLPYILIGDFVKTPYARYGAIALALLIPLALTSNRWAMRGLGKWWKRLHWLVYLALPLAVYHYWQRQSFVAQIPPFPTTRMDYRQPLLFAIGVGLLLLVRIPPLRRLGQQLRMRLATIIAFCLQH